MDPADLLRLLEAPTDVRIKTEDEIKQEPHEDDEEMMSTIGRQAVYARVFNVGYSEAVRMENQADLIQTNRIETKDKQILKWRKIWAKYRKGPSLKKEKKEKKKTRWQPERKATPTTNTDMKSRGRPSSSPKVSPKSKKPLTQKNVVIKKVAKPDEKKQKDPKQEPKIAEPAKKRGRPPKTISNIEPPKKAKRSTESTDAVEKNVKHESTRSQTPAVVSNKQEIKKEVSKIIPKPVEPAKKRGRPPKTINTIEPPEKQQKSIISTNAVEKKKYICPTCSKTANKSTCLCNQCGEWVHLKCAKIRASQYDSSFRCQNCSI